MYRAEITHLKEYSFKVKTASAEFVIDASGSGLTPLDALLSGLASCVGVYIRKYTQGAKLDLDNFKVTVEGELSKDSPLSFKRIDVFVDLLGASLDDRRLQALMAFIKNCPAHNTLKGNPEVKFVLV